jgi:PAS domain S-box-containing protein
MKSPNPPPFAGKIVVIDDNPATLYSTTRILETGSFQVRSYGTGLDGLNAVDSSVDALVVDINLPDIDGIEIVRRLRAGPETSALPIIHLTATKVEDEDRVEGLDAGSDAYLTHPVHPQVLLATVRTLLRARNAEAAKRRSEVNFRRIFDQATCGLAVLDRDLNFVDANPEMLHLLGRTSEEVAGREFFAFSDAERAANRDEVQAALAREKSWRGVVREIRGDGAAVELEWNLSPSPYNDTLLAVVTDITERLRIQAERESLFSLERVARAEAERIGRVKDEFLATLAHELRNPLAPLQNAVHLLQLAGHDAPTAKNARDVINRQIRQMTRLVDDLMDVSRITRGLVELNRQLISLDSALDAALEMSRPHIDAAGQRLHVDYAGSDVLVCVDPLRLAQVLTNVLNNASKYTPREGRIDVSVTRLDGNVEVTVEDSGIGIPVAMLANVFDMFTQVHPSGRRSSGGLGIGLTLAKRLMEMHGGTIRAFSEGEGKGSRFVVRLPLASQQADPPATRAMLATTFRTAGAVRSAVIIDDNRDAAESLCALLGALGYLCRAFFDGASGIAGVEQSPPDVVFIDIGMPVMDGHDVARTLRESPHTRYLPLFALTGWGQRGDRLHSKEAGFDRHLVKPVSATELQRVLDEVDAIARQRRANTPV